jgi:hypothetical protein
MVTMPRSLLAIPLVGAALAIAGCGGSNTPSVASLATTTSSLSKPTTTGAARTHPTTTRQAELASCLTAHGFQSAIGSAAAAANSSVSIGGVVVNGNIDPSSPQFQAAMQACRKYLPAGPPPLSHAGQAVAVKAMVAFASCMRSHGIPRFPDPDSQGQFPLPATKGIDPSSPLVLTAFKACESLEPKVGPRIEFEAGGNIVENAPA